MAQAYFSLVTNAGKIKLAQSAAGGAPVVITHFAVGDGNGAETNPTAASVALVREVWRTPVESVVTDPENPSAVLVTAIIPTSAGGWWMREFGVFDAAGAMVAVAKPVSQYKPTALEGQLEDIRYEFQIIIGESANVTLLVDPSLLFATRAWVEARKIPMVQMMRLPWLPVISMTTIAPPGAPAQGDTYLVPDDATGAWAAKVGNIAEWAGSAWSYASPPNGHGISLPDGRVFERLAGVYVELVATETRKGLVELATIPEAVAGEDAERSVTPAGLHAAVRSLVATRQKENLVLYCRPDGNDGNDGLSNTPAGAFRQVRAAIDKIRQTIDMAGYIAVIHLADGSYGSFVLSRTDTANIQVIGNTASPANVVIGDAVNNAVVATNGSTLYIEGVKLSAPAAGKSCLLAFDRSTIDFKDVDFGGAAIAHLYASSASRISAAGNYTISAGAGNHALVGSGSTIEISGALATITAAMSFSQFVQANNGTLLAVGSGFPGAGFVSGARYLAHVGGVIYTAGGGANYFAGNAPGTTESGGIYI